MSQPPINPLFVEVFEAFIMRKRAVRSARSPEGYRDTEDHTDGNKLYFTAFPVAWYADDGSVLGTAWRLSIDLPLRRARVNHIFRRLTGTSLLVATVGVQWPLDERATGLTFTFAGPLMVEVLRQELRSQSRSQPQR